MRTTLPILVTLFVTSTGCTAQTSVESALTQPTSIASSMGMGQNDVIRISGVIYELTTTGEPPIAEAIIDVTKTTGSRSTRSGPDGSYAVMVEGGDATITASKQGYRSKTWRITASMNTVLNFSLAPI